MGRFLSSVFTGLAAIGGHTKLPFGYRNFDTPDTTYNNLLFHYLALGTMPSMLQNNHHGIKKNAATYKWFEFDSFEIIIKVLRPLLQLKQ